MHIKHLHSSFHKIQTIRSTKSPHLPRKISATVQNHHALFLPHLQLSLPLFHKFPTHTPTYASAAAAPTTYTTHARRQRAPRQHCTYTASSSGSGGTPYWGSPSVTEVPDEELLLLLPTPSHARASL